MGEGYLVPYGASQSGRGYQRAVLVVSPIIRNFSIGSSKEEKYADERTTSPFPRTSSFSNREKRSGVTSRWVSGSYSGSPAAGVGSRISEG